MTKSPGFTAAVVLSLALGIGANAAIFSVVNGLLFHPAGINQPDRLVAPRVNYKKLALDKIALSATDFADIRDSRQIFSDAAMLVTAGFNYTGAESPERLLGGVVTWQWFRVFDRTPLLGRGFEREEDQPGANHVIVLSFRTWKRLFGGDTAIVGRAIELNRTPYRVIGVMPPNLWWPVDADIWVPAGLAPQAYGPDNRFNENYFAVARLAPGISYARASTAVQGLTERVLEQQPFARRSQWSMVLEPLTQFAAGDLKTPMLILLGAVAVVLLIACSNIAGLLLVRAAARSRESAIRTALGASRGDLMGLAFTETSVLAVLGTGLGFAMAFVILRALLSLARVQLSTELVVHIDGHVLAFTACAGLVSALLFGMMPAWHLSRVGQDYEQLKAGGRSDTETHARRTVRSVLVAGQIALAVVLVLGAGLLLKTLVHLQSVSTGFNNRGLATASVAMPSPEYDDPHRQIAFFHAVLDNLSNASGVTSAAAASTVPFSNGDPTASFSIEGRVVPAGDPGPHGSNRVVSPGYFKTLKIPLLAGRLFNDGDRENAQPVAIIDADLARRYWPNENPVGRRLRNGSSQSWATIVGIVGHVKQSSLAADSGRGAYYFSLYQQPASQAFFATRGAISTAQLNNAIRNAVHAADPAEAVFDFKTMDQRIALALGPQQFAARILLVFAAAALLLAVIGLYGVISYNVARRTREIGIRTALGAERTRIVGLVVGQAMRLLAIGLVCGFFVAALVGRLVASELFRVSAFDPATVVMTALVLTAAALLATVIPAWRAARVDPVIALRIE